MSTHFADATVHVDNLDSENEAADVEDLIMSALRGAGYYTSVTVIVRPYPIAEEPTP